MTMKEATSIPAQGLNPANEAKETESKPRLDRSIQALRADSSMVKSGSDSSETSNTDLKLGERKVESVAGDQPSAERSTAVNLPIRHGSGAPQNSFTDSESSGNSDSEFSSGSTPTGTPRTIDQDQLQLALRKFSDSESSGGSESTASPGLRASAESAQGLSTAGSSAENTMSVISKVWNSLDISDILPRQADNNAYATAEAVATEVARTLETSLRSDSGQQLPSEDREVMENLSSRLRKLTAKKSALSRAMMASASVAPFAPPLLTAAQQVPASGALYATTQAAFYSKTLIQLSVLATNEHAGGKEFFDSFKYRQMVSLMFSLAFMNFAVKEDPEDRQPGVEASLGTAAAIFAVSLAAFNPKQASALAEKIGERVGSLFSSSSQVSESTDTPSLGTEYRDSQLQPLLRDATSRARDTLQNLQRDAQAPLSNIANDKLSAVVSMLDDLDNHFASQGAIDTEAANGTELEVPRQDPDKMTKLALTAVAALASTTITLANAIPGNLSGFADFLLDGVLGVSELAKNSFDGSVNAQSQKALFTDLQGLTMLLIAPYVVDLVMEEPGSEAGDAFYALLGVMMVANITLPGPLGSAIGNIIEKGIEHFGGDKQRAAPVAREPSSPSSSNLQNAATEAKT